MRIACWITKATDRHSEFVLRIALRRQKYYARAFQCHVYTHIAYLVFLRLSESSQVYFIFEHFSLLVISRFQRMISAEE